MLKEIKRDDEHAAPPVNGQQPAGGGGVIWQGQVGAAFWKFATLFSFTVNIILVLVLLLVGWLLFDIKSGIAQPLVGGLYQSFVQMDNARIKTVIQVQDNIQVNDTMPVQFDLPLQTTTTVILNRATNIPNTVVYLNGAPVTTNIILPAGTPLEIQLNLTVPVNQTIPVHLNVPVNLVVPVDIPLNETDLHTPFSRLRDLFFPYASLLGKLPGTWDQALCQTSPAVCGLLPQ
jgi:hypothetical protein